MSYSDIELFFPLRFPFSQFPLVFFLPVSVCVPKDLRFIYLFTAALGLYLFTAFIYLRLRWVFVGALSKGFVVVLGLPIAGSDGKAIAYNEGDRV